MRRFRCVRMTLLALLLPMVGLFACNEDGSTVGQPTAAPSAGATQSLATVPTSPPAMPLLGPNGFGALGLGMTRTEAIATGLTTGTVAADTGQCGGPSDGVLAGSPVAQDETDVAGRLFFSASTGRLVAIYAFPGIKTPEGIGLGSTYERMHAVYPDWNPVPFGDSDTDGRGGVAVPGNSDAHYRIVVSDGKIVELSLDSNDQDCYE